MNIDSVAPNTAGPANGGAVPAAGEPRPARAEAVASSARNVVQHSSEDRAQTREPALSAQEATQRLNRFVSSVRPEINFTIDETSGVHVVRVVDSSTQEVIRQIPSEEVIRMAQVLDKLQGLFVKEAV